MNKFAILLTSCVSAVNCSKREIYYRKKLYLKVIDKWLTETNIPIYLVESSGYNFKIDHPRFKCVSFQQKVRGNVEKSQAEAKSILYAYKKFKKEWKDYTHIIKITGRYFLEDLEKWIHRHEKGERNLKIDIWHQNQEGPFLRYLFSFIIGRWINSEIFICRISKLKSVLYQVDTIMEEHLGKVIESGYYKFAVLPSFKNTLRSRRGGDNTFLEYL